MIRPLALILLCSDPRRACARPGSHHHRPQPLEPHRLRGRSGDGQSAARVRRARSAARSGDQRRRLDHLRVDPDGGVRRDPRREDVQGERKDRDRALQAHAAPACRAQRRSAAAADDLRVAARHGAEQRQHQALHRDRERRHPGRDCLRRQGRQGPQEDRRRARGRPLPRHPAEDRQARITRTATTTASSSSTRRPIGS